VSVGRILQSGGVSLGVTLSPRQCSLLERYVGLVLSWSARLNLTRARTAEEAALILVLDALACAAYLPRHGTIIDLGSGAGTPGVPIAVARPEVRLLLVEASRKKAGFLEVVLRDLGLENAEVIHARAETLGRAPAHRERHEGVTARALAELSVVAEYALPLLRVGGVAVLPKGPGADAEMARAATALTLLGGRAEMHASPPPARARIIVVRKIAPTPERYPRRPGVPARRPLAAHAPRPRTPRG
jgi:16S rRNA (guanine527-N7)-methyltransferase